MTVTGSAQPVPVDPGPRGRVTEAVAAAVDAVNGVRRSKGSGIEVATQYRGGRTLGVRLHEDGVEVHIVALRPDVADVAREVQAAARRALSGIGDGRPVTVVVDDLDVTSLSEGTSEW